MPDNPSDGPTESNSFQHPNDVRGKSGVSGASGPLNTATPSNDNPYASGDLIESTVPVRRMSLIEFLLTILGIFLGVSAGIGTCVAGATAFFTIRISEPSFAAAMFQLAILACSVIIGVFVFVKVFESFRSRDSAPRKKRSPEEP